MTPNVSFKKIGISSISTRLNFMNAYVVGKLNYILQLYMHTTNNLTSKLHKIIMTAARTVIGNYCPGMSISQILMKCKWLPIEKNDYGGSFKDDT